MSISTCSGPESNANETYPLALLKNLLRQMMAHFGAQGACIALYDEAIAQMRIQVHVRLQNVKVPKSAENPNEAEAEGPRHSGRRVTIKLLQEIQTSSSTQSAGRRRLQQTEELVDITPQQSNLFAVNTTYPMGQDLIGYIWHKNEVYTMRHEDYLTLFHANRPVPLYTDVAPHSYLVVPIRETPHLADDKRKPSTLLLGVIVLYHTQAIGTNFSKQHDEALQYVERIALYLQNDKLQRTQHRTSEYLRQLQGISTAFPNSVKLSDLVESIYHFTSSVADVSSMLLTLYDRDLDRLYDVFAVHSGERVEGIVEQPRIMRKEERPIWWNITLNEKRTLLFSPTQDLLAAYEYQELLTGIWGDQRQSESFLLLPMKMYNRIVGSLCITSMRPHAYQPEGVLALETMVQIVTVSIENARLYERDRRILQEARQREAELAATNSVLQAISSVLNTSELLNKLVEWVAQLVKVDICAFFQPTITKDMLFARALYGLSSMAQMDENDEMDEPEPPPSLASTSKHEQLINLIQLPFTETFLEKMIGEGFFYLDQHKLEELASLSNEGGQIFLRETPIRQMLMISMTYQNEFLGYLAVPTPQENNYFRPKDVGTLLAICAQTASAIRNAQLFEQREDAYAELERMNKLKDEFLVTASHELRTPLTAIRGYSSQLQRQSSRANPQVTLRFATKIAAAAQQLSDQVASMTEAAQMGAVDKNLNLHIEPVHVLTAAEMAVTMLTLNGEQNIILQIAPNIWFNGDGARIRQVLTNLLENATKYSKPDTPIQVSASTLLLSQTVTLLSEDQFDHTFLLENEDIPVVLVRVKDQGEGILPADQSRIFEKFVRAPRSLTTPVRGSGLGLYICRRFVEAMNGQLWLEQSVANEGSTFSFYLPSVAAPIEAGE